MSDELWKSVHTKIRENAEKGQKVFYWTTAEFDEIRRFFAWDPLKGGIDEEKYEKYKMWKGVEFMGAVHYEQTSTI